MMPQQSCLIIGLGYTGCRVLENIARQPGCKDLACLALDSDAVGLASLAGLGIQTIPLASPKELTPAQAIKALDEKQAEIVSAMQSYQLVICVAALGGNTGSSIGKILEYAYAHRQETVLLAVMPFDFEAEGRRALAEDALMQMEIFCRLVVLAPNDDMLDGANADELQRRNIDFLAQAAASLSVPLARQNIFNVTPGMYTRLTSSDSPRCRFVNGQSDGPHAGEELMNAVRQNPLFQSVVADKALALLRINGRCLTSELKSFFTQLKKEMELTEVEVATCLDNEQTVAMKLTLLLHPLDEDEVEQGAAAKKTTESKDPQIVIDFPDEGLGIFANDSANIWKGVNLDVPTFRRKNMMIDKGT